MKIGSLFSGAGGLDMAVAEVFGATVAWHSEIDKAACKVLAYRWPDVPNLGSITEIDWATVKPVDVLCGGFPCQDVSAAGKRAGIKDGTRSGLWAVFANAIDALRPQYVVIENVRGLLSATAHRNMESGDAVVGDRSDRPVLRAIGAVVGDLADLGYVGGYTVVSAASVGAPHRRERVFIVATIPDSPGSTGRNTQQQRISPLWPGWGADVQQPRERSGSDSACRGDAADASGNGRDERRPEPAGQQRGFDAAVGGDAAGRVELLPTPTSRDMKGRNQRDDETCLTAALVPTPNASDGSGGGQHPDKRKGHCRQLINYVLLCTPSASDGEGGLDLRTTISLLPTPRVRHGDSSESGLRRNSPGIEAVTHYFPDSHWGKYGAAIRRWEQVAGPAPAPTEPNRNGKPRLNPAFSEWMMGWPAGWVTDPAIGISRNDQLRIVGNGVCSQQAVAALRYLLAVTA